MLTFDSDYVFIEPFIEHQGEKRGFWLRKPRVIGENLLIARKASPVADPRKTIVFLELKSAFGSGGHGTTEGCLMALERFIVGGESVLDVGTGTGILAIAARKLGAGHITAIDIDRSACRETRHNMALNEMENGIDVIEGGIDEVVGRFDIIAANLRTPILLELTRGVVKKLKIGGIAIFSGILEREFPSFLSFLNDYPLVPIDTKGIHGWMTMVLSRRDSPSYLPAP